MSAARDRSPSTCVEMDSLARRKNFDRKNSPQIVEHRAQSPRGGHAHGYVVFLSAGRGYGIDRMRSGQRLIFAGERRCRDLRDHESGVQSRLASQKCGKQAGMGICHVLGAPLGNSTECGKRNGELIRSHSQRLSVEISAADYVPCAVRAIGRDKNKRIVSRAVEFDFRNGADTIQSITYCSVYLRGATHAVGVLHSRIAIRGAMRFANLASAIHAQQVARCRGVSGIGPRPGDARVECGGASAQRVKRECRGHVGGVDENLRLAQSERQERQHSLRSVQQRDSFLRLEHERRDARLAQRLAPRNALAVENSFALADDYLRQVRQRREIAGCPYGALRGNHRMDAMFQHRAEDFHNRWAYAAQPFRQCIRPQYHYRAGLRFRQWCSDATCVTANQIDLERSNLILRDSNFGQIAEACVHTVGRRLGGHDSIDYGARREHPRASFGGERYLGAMQGHFIKLFEGEVVAGEVDGHCAGGVESSADIWTSRATSKKRRYFSGSVLGFPCLSQTTWTVSPVASNSPLSSWRTS